MKLVYRVFICLYAAVNLTLPLNAEPQYAYDPMRVDKGGLNFDYIVMFSDSLGKSSLKIFANVIYDDLQFIKKGDIFQARYRVTFTILDSRGNYVVSKRVNRKLAVNDYFETNSRKKYDILENDFDLPPDEYTVKLELLDYETRESIVKDRKLTIPALKNSALLIAGPILLDTIVTSESGAVALRPGASGNVFDGQEGLWVYYEVFSRQYPLELKINYRLLDSKGETRINGDITRQIEGHVLRDKFQLDIRELRFDNYRLVMSVKNGDSAAQSTKSFRIRWPELPPTIRDLDTAIDQLLYIASDREIKRLKENYLGRKLEMFLKYWSKWGKDEAESAQLMDEYYRRIWESNQKFDDGGWRSDRGHVFVIHGSPDEVDRRIGDMYSRTYEIWYYIDSNKRFVFVDEGGVGYYRLQSPFWGN